MKNYAVFVTYRRPSDPKGAERSWTTSMVSKNANLAIWEASNAFSADDVSSDSPEILRVRPFCVGGDTETESD